jgi:hypothetical protein
MTAPESPPHPGPPGGPPPPDAGAPSPPPGPGVTPPFAAPPTEGRTARLWLGLGAAALAVVLFCGGGTAALIGFSVASTQAVREQARTVVSDYLEAVRRDDYGKAYDLLCEQVRRQESRQAFEQRVGAEPKISSYRIGQPAGSNQVNVPVDVTYAGDRQRQLRFLLVAQAAAGLRICGIS